MPSHDIALHSSVLACGPGDHIDDKSARVLGQQNGEVMEEWWCKWNGGVNRMIEELHVYCVSLLQ